MADGDLVFEYGKEEGLANDLLTFAMSSKNFVENKTNSLWQTTYILTKLPGEALAKEEDLILHFMTKMKDNHWVGKRTQSDFDLILEKME